MRRSPEALALALLLAGPAVAQPAAAPPATAPAAAPAEAPAPAPAKPARPAIARATPNAERVVEIAALDKRTGQEQLFRGRPGQSFRFGGLDVTIRTCETTPPWEAPLTGAFVQISERSRSGTARIFSGWMFAQSPSLNPLEHPRYDVWVKSCAMRWPDTGPDTVVVGSASRSSAPKSPEPSSATANNER